MSDIIPQYFLYQLSTKKVDFDLDNFKCMLCSGAFNDVFLRDVQTYADVSANECVGGSYIAGGVETSGTSAIVDNNNNKVLYFCDDIIFSAIGGNIESARYGVLYDSDADNTIVYIFDFGENKTIFDGSNLIIKLDENGFIKLYQKE